MSKFLLTLFCFTSFLPGLQNEAAASHMRGADLSIECVTGCTVRVSAAIYVECHYTTYTPPLAGLGFKARGTCAGSPVALGPWSAVLSTEITPICPSQNTLCTNSSSSYNGLIKYTTYRDYSICAAPTCSYMASYLECCRLPGSSTTVSNYYVETWEDFSLGCNASPVFGDWPVLYACLGDTSRVDLGGYDPDGDLLVYQLADCQSDSAVVTSYNAGFSGAAPLGANFNVSVDSRTGLLTVLPQPGVPFSASVCVRVDEYRNGTLIGQTTRDLAFNVINCASSIDPSLAGPTNLVDAYLQSDTLFVCAGVPFFFDFEASDPDTSLGQSVHLYAFNDLAGSQFYDPNNIAIQNHITGNSPLGRFTWTAPANGSYRLSFRAMDTNCPYSATTDQVLTVIAGASAPAIASHTSTLNTCAGTQDTLSALPGYSSYAWSNSASTQTTVVSAAGAYTVSVTTAGGCTFVDTVHVTDLAQPDVSGVVTDHLNSPLNAQKIYLIRHDTATASLFAVDSTFTNAAGEYRFCTAPVDTAYIKAAPDSSAYPLDFPTYADTTLFWMDAVGRPASAFPAVVSFSTRFGMNPGGLGFIGGLLSMGANKRNGPGDPVAGVVMSLWSESLGHVVAQDVSDQNGYFSFAAVPFGNYKVIADKPMVSVANVPAIVLDGQAPVRDSLDFRLHSTYLELVQPVSISVPDALSFSVQIVPNPVTDDGSVVLDLPARGGVQVSLYDAQGRLLSQLAWEEMDAGTHAIPFSKAGYGLSAGLYFVKVEAGSEMKTQRLVLE